MERGRSGYFLIGKDKKNQKEVEIVEEVLGTGKKGEERGDVGKENKDGQDKLKGSFG